MEVLKAINAVQAALVMQGGISKERKNSSQGYSFRGIDDMYNVLSPMLAKAGLVILPSYADRVVVEREGRNGGALFYVTLRGDFTFRSTKDESEVRVSTFGEAMDSGDKATNKAMSAALKYALMQTFTIPTEGDNDSENHTHEVTAAKKGPTITPRGGFYDSLEEDMKVWVTDKANAVRTLLHKDDERGAWDELTSHDHQLNENTRAALWDRFDSKERSRLTKISQSMKGKAA